MDPHVPHPHVPQNEKVALYSGIFLNVPSMYPYTIAWGLISHVPQVMLMYLSLKMGIDPSCTQSNPHVPLSLGVGFNLSCTPHVPPFILHVPLFENGFQSLMYPSCTPFASPCTLQ